MHSAALLVGAAAIVAVVHSVLPDHWVPIAVVARTQRWSLLRVVRISGLAAGGHVLASLVLACVIALIGLRYEQAINAQQGHIVGGVLVVTGLGFLVWGWTGHGQGHSHEHGDHSHADGSADGHDDHEDHEDEPHEHQHALASPGAHTAAEDHLHEHRHADVVHTHAHQHEAYVRERAELIAHRSTQQSLAVRLAVIAVPFGVAASPDLTILPVGLAAAAYGGGLVTSVLVTFGLVTMATFVGLTVAATAAGFQVKGLWLEKHANTITSLVLIAIGMVAYFGF